MATALDNTLDHRCTHKRCWLIGPCCRGNGCPKSPFGRCVRPPFHDGECMCASCQTDLAHQVSQNISRRYGVYVFYEAHDASSCTLLWARRYNYIYDKADSPSSASSTSGDYPWDKPWKEIPRQFVLEEGMLEREFDGGSTPTSVAYSDHSKHSV